MSPCLEIQLSELQKYNLHIYRNTKHQIEEIQLVEVQNTNDIFTEIQVTFELWVTFE